MLQCLDHRIELLRKYVYLNHLYGARYRVRTCDPYRVKVVLYH